MVGELHVASVGVKIGIMVTQAIAGLIAVGDSADARHFGCVVYRRKTQDKYIKIQQP